MSIEIKKGTHTRGDPAPEHDFSYVIQQGLISKGNAIACSNQDVKDQIDRAYKKNPGASHVNYFYFSSFEEQEELS